MANLFKSRTNLNEIDIRKRMYQLTRNLLFSFFCLAEIGLMTRLRFFASEMLFVGKSAKKWTKGACDYSASCCLVRVFDAGEQKGDE